jgi:hypothetical protein
MGVDDGVPGVQLAERGGTSEALRLPGRRGPGVPLGVRDDRELERFGNEPAVQMGRDDLGSLEAFLGKTRTDRTDLEGQRAEHDVVALAAKRPAAFEERTRRRRLPRTNVDRRRRFVGGERADAPDLASVTAYVIEHALERQVQDGFLVAAPQRPLQRLLGEVRGVGPQRRELLFVLDGLRCLVADANRVEQHDRARVGQDCMEPVALSVPQSRQQRLGSLGNGTRRQTHQAIGDLLEVTVLPRLLGRALRSLADLG